MIRIVKRNQITSQRKRYIYVITVICAIIVLTLYFLGLGKNPINVYISLLNGSMGSKFRVLSTLKVAIPLFIVGIAIAVAFKMRFWNIGAEGQIMMGAIFSTYFALYYSNLPRPILLFVMVVASIIGGGLWGGLAGFIKVKLNTNETIVTLMLNYVAFYFLTYLQYEPWKDPNSMGFPKMPSFEINAILPKIFGLHIGWVFAIIIGIIAYYFMTKSKLGYEIAVLGESKDTAIYTGIDPVKLTLLVTFISGGLAGLSGMIQSSAVMTTLSTEVTMGVGYTAIIVAWLGKMKPINIFVVSILFSILTQGGYFLQSSQGLPASAIGVLQATILFFALSSNFFIDYKIILRRKENL